ncbi:transcription antitermination factor NusB [Ornithinicoccus halotolerans]|uniref:transcription antitermination factor NusB n=1 Tax=Ornithinicoccus halotolerans TaxID=1748220 RepID=UPI001295303F|nr:transcription antitermination factor NusB [Ornithinicoccus halotolerans]
MAARSKARKRALELLYEAEQRGLNVTDLLEQRLAAPTTQHPLPEYTAQLVRGVVQHWATINETIATYSQGWPLERMASVDRGLLRLATWEIVWNPEVPDAVAISEARELARTLSTDESPAFLQGLLGRIAEVKDTVG